MFFDCSMNGGVYLKLKMKTQHIVNVKPEVVILLVADDVVASL